MAVATITNEEGENDHAYIVKAPRILVKATCSAFKAELKVLEKKGRVHALRVENYPVNWNNSIC